MKVPMTQDCAKCHSDKLVFNREAGTPHHGRLTCGKCKSFITWVSKDLSRFLSRFVMDKAEDTKSDGALPF